MLLMRSQLNTTVIIIITPSLMSLIWRLLRSIEVLNRTPLEGITRPQLSVDSHWHLFSSENKVRKQISKNKRKLLISVEAEMQPMILDNNLPVAPMLTFCLKDLQNNLQQLQKHLRISKTLIYRTQLPMRY